MQPQSPALQTALKLVGAKGTHLLCNADLLRRFELLLQGADPCAELLHDMHSIALRA